MDYWEQELVIVCELCAGGHYTHQCEYNRNRPNFNWSNNQYGMQQSYQPSYSFQNQQYSAWPYNSSEIQQQQGQQFQQQYVPWQQQFQPAEFQEQQFHTSYGQQSNEEAELKELRLMFESQAESLKTMESLIGQIANALRAEQEVEQRSRDIDSAVAPLLAQPSSIEVQPETSVGKIPQDQKKAQVVIQFPAEDEEYSRVEVVDTMQSIEFVQPLQSDPLDNALQGESEVEDEKEAEQEDEKEAKPEANHPKNSESPENSVLKNQPSPHLLLSENSAKPLQDQEKAKANVYPPPPYPQHVQMLNAAPWRGSFNIPYEAFGLEDLWNSQVRLKPSSEEDKLWRVLGEFKSAIGWIIADVKEISPSSCMHKIFLEEGSKPTVEHQGRIYSIMKEGVKEEIIKWPMFGVYSTFHPGQMILLYNSQLKLFPGSSTENSAIAKLDEFRHQVCENAKLYKEQVKRWHDRHLAYKALHPP